MVFNSFKKMYLAYLLPVSWSEWSATSWLHSTVTHS